MFIIFAVDKNEKMTNNCNISSALSRIERMPMRQMRMCR